MTFFVIDVSACIHEGGLILWSMDYFVRSTQVAITFLFILCGRLSSSIMDRFRYKWRLFETLYCTSFKDRKNRRFGKTISFARLRYGAKNALCPRRDGDVAINTELTGNQCFCIIRKRELFFLICFTRFVWSVPPRPLWFGYRLNNMGNAVFNRPLAWHRIKTFWTVHEITTRRFNCHPVCFPLLLLFPLSSLPRHYYELSLSLVVCDRYRCCFSTETWVLVLCICFHGANAAERNALRIYKT